MTQPQNQGQYGPPMQGQSGPAQGQYDLPQQGPLGSSSPAKKNHTGRNVVLAILGIFILIAVISVVAVGGSSNKTTAKKMIDNADTGKADSDTKSSTNHHTADATISSCAKDATSGLPVAEVKVTNTSSKPANYIVTVSFNRGSQQLDTGIVGINNLNPGASSTQEAASLKMDVPAGFTCKIEGTTRLSAVG